MKSHYFPKHVWTWIFNYLNLDDIAIVCCVSKSFRAPAKNIKGYLRTTPIKAFDKLYKYCPRIEQVSLTIIKKRSFTVKKCYKIRITPFMSIYQSLFTKIKSFKTFTYWI